MSGVDSVRSLARRSAAEFLVIVFGVLVALAVDDRRQSIRDRQFERDALQQVQNDLNLDGQDLALAASRASRRAVAGIRLLEKFGEAQEVLAEVRNRTGALTDLAVVTLPSEGADSVGQEVMALFRTQVFDPTRSAFSALLSGGALRLIRDDTTRWALVSYYGFVDAMLEAQPVFRNRQQAFVDHLARLGVTQWDLLARRGQFLRLRADPTFQTEIRTILWFTQQQISMLKDIERRRMELLRLVESQLTRR